MLGCRDGAWNIKGFSKFLKKGDEGVRTQGGGKKESKETGERKR